MNTFFHIQFSSVQSLSRVRLFTTPWTAARQASLSITNSQSPPKPVSIESVMPPNHLILCHPPSPPALNLSQCQDLFHYVGSSHQVAKVYELVATNIQAITITNYFTRKNQTWFQDVLKNITYDGGKTKRNKTLNERNCVYIFCLKCTGNPEHCTMPKTVNKW